MLESLESIERRYTELNELMSQPEVAVDFEKLHSFAKEQASIENLVAKYREYKSVMKSLEETKAMLTQTPDNEMAELIKDEVGLLQEKRARLLEEIRLALVPRDPAAIRARAPMVRLSTTPTRPPNRQ